MTTERPELSTGLSLDAACEALAIDESALTWLASRGLLRPRWDGSRYVFRPGEVAERRPDVPRLLALRDADARRFPVLRAGGFGALAVALAAGTFVVARVIQLGPGVVEGVAALVGLVSLRTAVTTLARWNKLRENRLTFESWRRTFARGR